MHKESMVYNDENLEATIDEIEDFEANFGGTEISAPLLDIVKVDKQMKPDFLRHVILITDGQVFNPEVVIQTIGKMRGNNVATTHAVGIGSGVSFDMIRRGAVEGGGEHVFIMDNNQMKKQIIFLLESITCCEMREVALKYDDKLFTTAYPLVPSILKKGRESSFFLRLSHPVPAE